MQILVITTSYPTQAHPVSGVFIHRMLACLPGDIQIRVLTPQGRQPSWHPVQQGRIRLLSFRYGPRFMQTLAHQPGGIPAALQQKPLRWLLVPLLGAAMLQAAWIEARKADLMQANWSICGVLAGLVGRVRAIPTITVIRGTDMAWAGRYFVCRWLLKLCLMLNQRVVTVSEAMARQLGEWFPRQRRKIDMIPNGVNPVSGAVPPRFSGAFTFVVLGNLIAPKRVDLVIGALGILSGMYADARLRIVGDGPERERLGRLAHALKLEDRIHFTGQLNPEQVAAELAGCHALVLASASEGRPNAVLEAMACGVPVVASDIDGVRELIVHEERGLLFAPGDMAQLARGMRRLLTQPDLGLRLSANARQWIHDQGLTWENTAARYAALYRLIISRQRQRRR